MITLVKRTKGIPYLFTWFGGRPAMHHSLLPCVYMQSTYPGDMPGFLRKKKHTILVDLTQSIDAIRSDIKSRIRNKINRAEREGVTVTDITDINEFKSFYDAFARSIGLPPVNPTEIIDWGSVTVGFAARFSDETLVVHSYIVDEEASRARLLHSGSMFRQSADSKMIGFANCYLHYQAMLTFKARGLDTYDFGGVSQRTDDPQLATIARFKRGFGGQLVAENNYESYPMFALRRAQGGVQKLANSLEKLRRPTQARIF